MSQFKIDLAQYLNSKIYRGRENVARTEQYLQRAYEFIRDLEKDAEKVLKGEWKNEKESLQGIIERNNKKFLEREKLYVEALDKQDKKIKELTSRLPLEERLKEVFICFSCEEEWSKEFLRFTDKKGNQFCSKCMSGGTAEAGKEIGHSIYVEDESPEEVIKSFKCEFCHGQFKGDPTPVHITNAPDGRSSKLITLVCQNCSLQRVKKDWKINYCPKRTSPCDDPDRPEYDCDCPRENYLAI